MGSNVYGPAIFGQSLILVPLSSTMPFKTISRRLWHQRRLRLSWEMQVAGPWWWGKLWFIISKASKETNLEKSSMELLSMSWAKRKNLLVPNNAQGWHLWTTPAVATPANAFLVGFSTVSLFIAWVVAFFRRRSFRKLQKRQNPTTRTDVTAEGTEGEEQFCPSLYYSEIPFKHSMNQMSSPWRIFILIAKQWHTLVFYSLGVIRLGLHSWRWESDGEKLWKLGRELYWCK